MKETETHYASRTAQATQSSPKISDSPSGSETDQNPGDSSDTKPSVQKKLDAPVIGKLKGGVSKTGVYVDITVNPVQGAEGYEIYRTAGGKTVAIGKISAGKTLLSDKNPVKQANYYAVAYAEGGKIKSQAGAVKAIKLADTVKIKRVSKTSKGIKITWKKSKKAVKYVIYRSTKKNAGYKKFKTLKKKSLSYIDKKAKKGKKYYYKIAVVTKSNPRLLSKPSKRIKR